MAQTEKREKTAGKLKIGDDWNAITIIALSQNNPLKAIAEFVENSIDAKAKHITLTRGKEKGDYYLRVSDDGEGIDDFHYLATHIGDSLKRKLKQRGVKDLQGEFGIGLLSFWTVGEELTMTSTGSSGETRRLRLVKGNSAYSIEEPSALFKHARGTDIVIHPILAGVRFLSGEKIQNYLASELRDRITKSGVKIKIVDKASHREFSVDPHKYEGRLMHGLPEARSPLGEIYAELYLSSASSENRISLCKNGTRVIDDLRKIDDFCHAPWTSPYLEGLIDCSFLQLTPGTRDGVIYDAAFASLLESLGPLEDELLERIKELEQAEEEEASRAILGKVARALKEAFLLLPRESYSWLNIQAGKTKLKKEGGEPGTLEAGGASGEALAGDEPAADGSVLEREFSPEEGQQRAAQKDFFDYAGPLHKAVISPASMVVGVEKTRFLKIVARDKSRRVIDSGLEVEWSLVEGPGELEVEGDSGLFATFRAGREPGLCRITATVTQGEIVCPCEAIVTVTAELLSDGGVGSGQHGRKGLPDYTYQKAPGELWRSRYDADKNIIIINSGHADFIYSGKQPARRLRYIGRLFAKELVLFNFPEASKPELLERMIELNLYMEENLR
jgi:hypothetical protein